MSKGFFGEVNIQQVPKPDSLNYYIRKADSSSIPEYTIEGYEFTTDVRKDSLGKTEGFSPLLNLRKAFLPEPNHYWVSRDFSGQELRILANLSNEKVWINSFLHGEDIHKATAEAVWGKDNYNKEKRSAAKTLNFGLIYGMSAWTLAEQLKVTEKEAQAYIDEFFKSLPSIQETLNRFALQAQENKEISNVYGRKRRMGNYISDYGQITNFGRRRSYNFPVQSLGAEITKLALIKLYHQLINNPKYKGDVFFLNTIHDEINISVSKDKVKEVVKIMGDCMLHNIPGRPVPIVSGLEIGNSMGLTWKFKQDPETLELTPEMEELTEEDLKSKGE